MNSKLCISLPVCEAQCCNMLKSTTSAPATDGDECVFWIWNTKMHLFKTENSLACQYGRLWLCSQVLVPTITHAKYKRWIPHLALTAYEKLWVLRYLQCKWWILTRPLSMMCVESTKDGNITAVHQKVIRALRCSVVVKYHTSDRLGPGPLIF